MPDPILGARHPVVYMKNPCLVELTSWWTLGLLLMRLLDWRHQREGPVKWRRVGQPRQAITRKVVGRSEVETEAGSLGRRLGQSPQGKRTS